MDHILNMVSEQLGLGNLYDVERNQSMNEETIRRDQSIVKMLRMSTNQ